LNVQVSEDNVNIVFSRDLVNDRDLMDFVEKVKVKNLFSKSKLPEEDAQTLDMQLKSDWWRKNKERYLY